jgi:hypothetical protein
VNAKKDLWSNTLIINNPFLGPKWGAVGETIEILLNGLNSRNNFHIQTYIRKFNLSPDTSPYVQGLLEEDGSVHMEISGNLQVRPSLTDEQMESLVFYGWEKPDATVEEYREHHEGIPNFYRLFEPNMPKIEIAEAILTALVGVYGMTEEDFLNFGTKGEVVARLGLLGRLKASDGNPNRDIFALPGEHLDMIESRQPSQG